MSTYTDLHNRVKESLAVDYHTRVTPQVISALNQENEFWGRFKGSFSGGVQDSTLSGSVISDSDFVRGRSLSSVLNSPKLFLSVDEDSGRDVVQDLTAYVAEHGSGGIRPEDLSGLMPLSGGEFTGGVSFAEGEPGLSVSFGRLCDPGGVPLSALLRDLADKDTVLDVCARVNDIIDLARLAVPRLDFETCSCADLFDSVRMIARDEAISSFGEAVSGLNRALSRLSTGNASLEDRLAILQRRVDDARAAADRAASALSAEISLRARLSDVKDGKLVIRKNGAAVAEFTANSASDVIADIQADAPVWGGVTGALSAQSDVYSAISAKASREELSRAYGALSGLPDSPADFNIISHVAPALIALRNALSAFA